MELQARDQSQPRRQAALTDAALSRDPREHREDVVRRLLATGLTPACVTALLPEWSDLIARLAANDAADEAPAPALRHGDSTIG